MKTMKNNINLERWFFLGQKKEGKRQLLFLVKEILYWGGHQEGEGQEIKRCGRKQKLLWRVTWPLNTQQAKTISSYSKQKGGAGGRQLVAGSSFILEKERITVAGLRRKRKPGSWLWILRWEARMSPANNVMGKEVWSVMEWQLHE